jgi:hypothetical protein
MLTALALALLALVSAFVPPYTSGPYRLRLMAYYLGALPYPGNNYYGYSFTQQLPPADWAPYKVGVGGGKYVSICDQPYARPNPLLPLKYPDQDASIWSSSLSCYSDLFQFLPSDAVPMITLAMNDSVNYPQTPHTAYLFDRTCNLCTSDQRLDGSCGGYTPYVNYMQFANNSLGFPSSPFECLCTIYLRNDLNFDAQQNVWTYVERPQLWSVRMPTNVGPGTYVLPFAGNCAAGSLTIVYKNCLTDTACALRFYNGNIPSTGAPTAAAITTRPAGNVTLTVAPSSDGDSSGIPVLKVSLAAAGVVFVVGVVVFFSWRAYIHRKKP